MLHGFDLDVFEKGKNTPQDFFLKMPRGTVFFTTLLQPVTMGGQVEPAGAKVKVLIWSGDQAFIEPPNTMQRFFQLTKQQLSSYVLMDESVANRPAHQEMWGNYQNFQQQGKNKSFSGPEGQQRFTAMITQIIKSNAWLLVDRNRGNSDMMAEQVLKVITGSSLQVAFGSFISLLNRNRDLNYIWNYIFKNNYAFKQIRGVILNAEIQSMDWKSMIGTPQGNTMRDTLNKLNKSPSSYSLSNIDEFWAESIEKFESITPEIRKQVLQIVSGGV